MKLVFAILSSIFCFVSATPFAHEGEHVYQSQPHRHMQYAKEKNPIPMDEQSVKKGAELYEKHCVACHGKGGKAGGSLDLTKTIFIHGESDGEIFHVITDGVKEPAMPAYKKELSDEMRWNLVNYIKSLKGQKKD